MTRMERTYLFYDIETTGRSKCFDQILQFAAIRTDLALNELERHYFQIKLNSDFIPDPEAILIHRIPIETMLQGSSEIAAVTDIHQLVNTPGTVSGGYNTLGFDDEFLRFSFHRNLLPPYTHQWADGCGRFDLYPITQLYYLYHHHCLTWPVKPDGKNSLKLAEINAANQLITHGKAHEAMTDVEVTLALARIFFQHKETWDYVMGFFDKATESKRHARIHSCLETEHNKYRLALLIGNTGSADLYQTPVLALGQHKHYKNQTVWLRVDKPELVTTTLDTITQVPWIVRTKPGENFLLPLAGRFKQHLSQERLTIIETNMNWLRANESMLQSIQAYYCDYKYPEIPNLDVDADLYVNGFLTREEQIVCQQFHAAPPEKKPSVLKKFHNPRLQEIAMRLIGRHYQPYLTAALKEQFNAYLCRVNPQKAENSLIDWQGKPRLTPKISLAALDLIRATNANQSDTKLLDELETYIKATFLV